MAKLDSIQYMRGVAAISVVFSHLPFISMGGYGVDLFFIISGFIISYISSKGMDYFLLKRVIRVVPLYWSMTVLVSVVALFAPFLLSSTTLSSEYFLKSLFFIPFDKNGYVEPILALGWTLNYEMFFYLIYFLGALISYRYRSYVASAMIVVFVLLGALSDLDSIVFDFYTSPILLEFIFGMLAAELYMKSRVYLGKSVVFSCLFFVCVIFLFLIPGKSLGDYRFATWGLGSFLLFFILTFSSCWLPFYKGLVWLGKISYSLYLTHIFVILFVNRLIFDMSVPNLSTLVVAFSCIVLCICAAYTSWYTFENGVSRKISKYLGLEKGNG